MVLRVKNLVYRHARSLPPVLDHIDLTLLAGDMLCLLGPNGSGKTTLLRCLIGALRPDSGSIRIAGEATPSARQRARKLAYVPQASGDSGLSLLDTVLAGRTPYLPPLALPSQADRCAARSALERVGLGHLAEQPFNRVSGGERQLTLIARALAQAPTLFLLDEPTASLDMGNQVRVLRTLRELSASGAAVLFTSHQPDHALLLDAQVALLNKGQMSASGPAGQVLSPERMSALYQTDIDLVAWQGKPVACVPRM